jgi:UDPglucose--hexose-1-phosphate uridylyltransferase
LEPAHQQPRALLACVAPARRCLHRTNPLLSTAHRTQRPWQGAQEKGDGPQLPAFDDKCYLCPGNERATGGRNDQYDGTFVSTHGRRRARGHCSLPRRQVFENDYAALKPEAVEGDEASSHPLLRSTPARGRCYVLCFHPKHNLTIAQLTTAPYSARSSILPIVHAWRRLYLSIPQENPFVSYVQIFENKGSAMGCSNPHPHGQIWSLDYVPEEPRTELLNMQAYALDARNAAPDVLRGAPLDEQGRASLLLTYAHLELNTPGTPRVVAQNAHFVTVVPYWALWPFETMLLPYKRHISSLEDMTDEEQLALAELLGETACRLDNIFGCSFPYSMGIHQRPAPRGHKGADAELGDFAHFHIHFYPPLLRSATVRKFLVG